MTITPDNPKTPTHFQQVVDYVMGGDESELAKVKAERDYALHALEREIAIAQSEQVKNAALVKALRLAERIVADRASGGRMLANKEDAEAALVLCHEALALVGGSKQP